MTQAPAICPACKVQFAARRSNQKYCSDNCRKAYYQAKDRAKNPANSQYSKSVKRANAEFFDRAMYYSEELYSVPPDQRLKFMKTLIEKAREGDVRLRQMLSNQILLKATPTDQRYYWRRSSSFPNIAQVANNYCWKSWGANVKQVVYCNVDAASLVQAEGYDPSQIIRTKKLKVRQTVVSTYIEAIAGPLLVLLNYRPRVCRPNDWRNLMGFIRTAYGIGPNFHKPLSQ
jgi:hypothetical protein